ncbi:hypothetical protein OPT61_g7183 [Boeremia exigua]|uniref:Uncharacterized protein n=1 Tax=Boeremia exigua TaxID=749465 RepID=A0ACC2I3F7_9PLEO|nr:hypothetical protein OPT61_g7183 [Boeremia exigua]
MAQIYKDCDSMVIWLGSKDQKFREAADEFIYKPRPHSLSTLLHDDYFTRLWVVQEVLLARAVRIMCYGTSGHVEIPWDDVHAVATGSSLWLQQHGHTKAVLALIANQGMNRYEGLRVTIARFSGYECENPRDKVYGLLGIVKPKERLEVDYTKSVQDVFLDAARTLQASKMDRPDRVNCKARLESLARKMNLATEDRGLVGLRAMLQDVFASTKTERSLLAKLPKTARVRTMGFDPQRSGASLADDASKRRLARWWCEFEGKRYYHACCSCQSTAMCRCNPGKAIVRKTLGFPWVAAGVKLTTKQKQALDGVATKADAAKASASKEGMSAEVGEQEDADEDEDGGVDGGAMEVDLPEDAVSADEDEDLIEYLEAAAAIETPKIGPQSKKAQKSSL